MSSFLFDITKDAMDLLPFLRQTPARSGDETVAATALNRLNNILTNIRGSSDRYNILRSAENRESKGLMDRLTESLKPLLNPLKIVTTHVAGNNSRLAAALKEETKN
ncbi:hypothetical protein JTE90_022171 [Oedothorax gibbosus]|uniref:Uncharacterized protein n=1 Tax=Oedothorax gibbosus TaxID=931172 RepID=A0AAV6VQE3_9ARAC|nr:hypothetical protein JTE90_022171 [Oedothorax gibbosus]